MKQTIYWYKGTKRTGKRSEMSFINGNPNGIKIEWFRNGNKELELHYIDGVLNGLYTRYFENGNKREEGGFKDNRKN